MKTSAGGSIRLGVRQPRRCTSPKKIPGTAPQEQRRGPSSSTQHDTNSTEPSAGGVLLALWLLLGGYQPRLTVEQLRRRCRYAGLTMTAAGQPIRFARRSELLALLQKVEVSQ